MKTRVVEDENLADFIIVGGTTRGVHNWYDTVSGSSYERDGKQRITCLLLLPPAPASCSWRYGWGPLKKGGRRKVAERLVNKMKGDLFKSGF